MAKTFSVAMAFSAINKATAPMRAIGSQLKKLRGQAALTARVLRFQRLGDRFRALGGSLKNFNAQLGRTMGGVRKLFAFGSIAAGGIFAGLAASVRQASAVEEQSSMFEAVFKKSSKGAEDWANNQAEILGRSRFDLMGYMAQFQDTFVPLGFARDQGAKLSKTMTKLAVDLSSFKNIPVAEAVESMTSAMVGNHEAVRKFGIVITQASLKQELMNLGVSGGIKAATEQQKVMARLNIILRSTTDAQGDAARTSDSFENTWRNMTAAISDLSTAIGKNLMPMLQPYIKAIADLIRLNEKFIAQKIGDAVKSVVVWLKSINWAEIAFDIKSFFDWTVRAKDAVGGWGNFLLVVVGILNAQMLLAIGSVITSIVQLGVVTGVTGLRLAGMAAASTIGLFVSLFKNVRIGVGIFQALKLAIVTNPIGAIALGLIIDNWGAVKDFFIDLKDWFLGWNIFNPIRDQVKGIIALLPDFIQTKLGFSDKALAERNGGLSDFAGLPSVQASKKIVDAGSGFMTTAFAGGANSKLAPAPATTLVPPQSQALASGGKNQVTVRFENAPPGLRTQTTQTGPNPFALETEMDVGRGLAGS